MPRWQTRPRVLMIAFQYPPFAGSSGVQRVLKFSRYLPENGWEPIVLTASPHAYVEKGQDQIAEIPRGTRVVRAWSLDAARHLSVGGRYPRWVASPDRWASWALAAIPLAIWMARRHRVSAIWSTFPIATAHLVGDVAARATGLPWIADCRDSMTDPDSPRDPRQRRAYERLERRVVAHAARVVVTTPGTARMYADRYPQMPASRWSCIPNGYDEDDFAGEPPARQAGRVVLLHSGVIYPQERDPRALFGALSDLRDAGRLSNENFQLRLRATGHDSILQPLAAEFGVENLVEFAPPIGHREAIREMCTADGLLILQAANCNHQIPAKVYEYMRSGRPIVALTDRDGDTGRTLITAGVDSVAPLDDRAAIASTIGDFLTRGRRSGDAGSVATEVAQRFSRRAQTAVLASVLDEVSAVRR